MPARMGQTRRNEAPRLLNMVSGGLPDRGEDREESQQVESSSQEGLRAEDWHELELDRSHVTSNDKALRPPPKSSKPTAPESNALRKPSSTKRKRKAEIPPRNPEPGLRKPARTESRVTTRSPAPHALKDGQYEQSHVAKKELEEDEENETGKQTLPTSSQGIWGFGLSSQTSQKSRKVTFGGAKTKNIHTILPSAKKRDSRAVRSGSKSSRESEASCNPRPENDGNDSEFSVMDNQELDNLGVIVDLHDLKPTEPNDPELRKVRPKKKPARTGGEAIEPSTLDDAELEDMLRPTLRDHLGSTLDTPDSSLPGSSTPHEEINDIDSYMRELPAEAEEGTACAICNESVSQDDYWSFWKDRRKTVRNQALFCHMHKKASAQKEYDAKGLKPIDWNALPSRIKKYRMPLRRILTGETPSTYRSRYEPLALTGKAAAVPFKRPDLSPSKQVQLASSALDDNAIYPGYYGPRGRRLITESVMRMLSSEIKRCADPVVQTSGPATFVQVVLVPEVAVRLIMEDFVCDWEQAEEVRARTFEMGVLLNEEIEDSVEVRGEDSEGGNEYLH